MVRAGGAAGVLAAGLLAAAAGAQRQAPPAGIRIDYPPDGAVFPPEFPPPSFLWRDPGPGETWNIEVRFRDGAAPIRMSVRAGWARAGETDPRAVADTNRPPAAPEAREWRPAAAVWKRIQEHSAETAAEITIAGTESRGRVAIATSRDPVGAPVFYRDVPLMPSEAEKGIIKPLAPAGIPLIAWRLRYLNEPRSRLLVEGLHTCTNCHSFSKDGRTLGMDVDGPENDKGTYAMVNVARVTTIAARDVITWNSFAGRPPGQRTIGFLSQVSPDGRYAVTTLNEELYVANFKDYRFLQVFYPTRGILAVYDRATGAMKALPGADDPRYVHTDAVWSPDGESLVFARAEARQAYPPGRKPAGFAGDPAEVPIEYDLYRIPFHGGRGGRAEPVAGASRNGMSNTFPRVSPDGKWIVFVQCRNGQLMRPDSRLFIVPAKGGEARPMRANTALMNSWHSFSPNGRWMVFSSKSRSPYTQMFLTHVDERGDDTPAVLIEDATAANRAVNLPEFVNLPPEGLRRIEVPASEFYRLFDSALELESRGRHREAIEEWKRALEIDQENAKAHTNLGIALAGAGAQPEALAHFRKAVELKPDYAEARNNLGVALAGAGRFEEATAQFRAVLRLNPDAAQARNNLGVALLNAGRCGEAAGLLREAAAANPASAGALNQAAWVLATCREAAARDGAEAVRLAARAVELSGGRDASMLDTLAAAYAETGRFAEAVEAARRALGAGGDPGPIRARLALYERRLAYRE